MDYTNSMVEVLKRIFAFFFDIIETIVLALAIFVVIYLFLFQPHQVKGASMEPSFFDGEYILTDKISYRLHSPKRGEVIIFKAPKNPELDYIKRIIGLPGERIKIENGDIFINDQKLNEEYIPENTIISGGLFLSKGKETKIPEKSYFVLGDNRLHSSDSREWGPIQTSDIVGKAFLRYWPSNHFGILPKAEYGKE